MTYDHPNFDFKNDSDNDVQKLYRSAMARKTSRARYKRLADLIDGKTIDLTKDAGLYEALNREKMEFEQLLNLHPEQTIEAMKEVKELKEANGGRWYNPDSQAWWGQKGVIPACCYYARPKEYWDNKKLMNSFLNQFPKFRVSESPL